MEEIQELIEVLELGIEKHGEKPLTNKYLLNILRIVLKNIEREDNFPSFGDGWDNY